MGNGTLVDLSVAADAFGGGGHRLEFYGDTGTLILSNATNDYASGFELMLRRRQDATFESLIQADTGTGDGRIKAVASIVRRFIDAILQNKTASPGLAEGLRVQFLLEAARKADRAVQWQSVT